MLIPSIDIANGDAVQLVGGQEMALNAGSPEPIASKFARVGPMAVIDLDAALSRGDNRELIEGLCAQYRCRVGGGIRNLGKAMRWLDAGAEQIIVGTAASPEFCSQLPRERVMAALDARDGEVVVKGWTEGTGQSILDRIKVLRPFVSGFLITFVECEGRLQGTRMDLAEAIVRAAGDARVTIAGGITTTDEVAGLDAMGADAQVGMALYTNQLSLGEAFAAPLKSDREDGLWPTVVVDEYQRALGLCYSNLESLSAALEQGKGIYWSRRRGLWVKGESSGHTQRLQTVAVDCDRDTIRFQVSQEGPGFCHLETRTCWGNLNGLPELSALIAQRKQAAPQGSYTRRLFEESGLLSAKLIEEAGELADAKSMEEVTHETADLLYFALTAMVRGGASLEDVESTLRQRRLKVSRRPGHAKVQVQEDRK